MLMILMMYTDGQLMQKDAFETLNHASFALK